ncbi:hypothetical protein CN332_28570 [Bacillus thuringiensis]|nr:hypothetical protein CN332_28570 [Bacillus thuringiensis]
MVSLRNFLFKNLNYLSTKNKRVYSREVIMKKNLFSMKNRFFFGVKITSGYGKDSFLICIIKKY